MSERYPRPVPVRLDAAPLPAPERGPEEPWPPRDGEVPDTAPPRVPPSPRSLPGADSIAGRQGGIRDHHPRGRTSGSCPPSAGGCPWGRAQAVRVPRGQGSVCLTPVCSQGIRWTPVEFFDNSIICNLIENVSCPPVPGSQRGVPSPPPLPSHPPRHARQSLEPPLGAGAGLG